MKKLIKKMFKIFGINLSIYRPGPEKMDFLKHYNINTIFDIGANIGEFATELRTYLPSAKIISYEPLKECFYTLNETMKGDANFVSFNLAIGNSNEEIEINKSDYTPCSSFLEMEDFHKQEFPKSINSTKEKVKIVTLDEEFKKENRKENILIKIDVQGFEDNVIKGGQDAIKKSKIVLIESCFVSLYKGQILFDGIYNSLKSLGFSYRGSINKKMDKDGNIIFEDSVFINESIQ